MPSLWGYSVFILSWLSALFLIKLSSGILKAGIHYKINQMFSLSLGFFALTVFFFPIGGTFFNGSPLMIVTTKIYYYGVILALIFSCWGAIIVYLGEENWNYPVLVALFSIIAVVYFLALCQPNSVFINPGTGTAMANYLLVLYGITSNLLIVSPGLLLVVSYYNTEQSDQLLRYQIRMFLIGFGLIFLAGPTSFLAEYLNIYTFDQLTLILCACALVVISRAFKRDMGLNHFKLLSALYRSRYFIKQGKIAQAERVLGHAEKVATLGGIQSAYVDILFMRVKFACLNSNFSQIDSILAKLEYEISLNQDHSREKMLKAMKQEVKMHSTANDLFKHLENVESRSNQTSLDDSLIYLDKIIAEFQSEIVELYQN
ncbi:MAG: hypothetical protein ACXADA_14680 [Candidatus Hodarchaeales archaeon]